MSLISIDIACARVGMSRKEMIDYCIEYGIPTTKVWGSDPPIIHKVAWVERLDNMQTKILTGMEGRLPVPGERCATKDGAARMGMSSTQFVSWCRKHHVEMGLDINDLQGYVPYILWTRQMQKEYEHPRLH